MSVGDRTDRKNSVRYWNSRWQGKCWSCLCCQGSSIVFVHIQYVKPANIIGRYEISVWHMIRLENVNKWTTLSFHWAFETLHKSDSWHMIKFLLIFAFVVLHVSKQDVLNWWQNYLFVWEIHFMLFFLIQFCSLNDISKSFASLTD